MNRTPAVLKTSQAQGSHQNPEKNLKARITCPMEYEPEQKLTQPMVVVPEEVERVDAVFDRYLAVLHYPSPTIEVPPQVRIKYRAVPTREP
jgi:hypothetical protein